MQASEATRGINFRTSWYDVGRKFQSNPLIDFYWALIDIVQSSSKEAVEIVKSKSKLDIPPPKKKRKLSHLNVVTSSDSSSSDESFGRSSTETTSPRLTQSLQNALVTAIIRTVWRSHIPIPWAQNRKMYLRYRPYVSTYMR